MHMELTCVDGSIRQGRPVGSTSVSSLSERFTRALERSYNWRSAAIQARFQNG